MSFCGLVKRFAQTIAFAYLIWYGIVVQARLGLEVIIQLELNPAKS
jgi:hypothetical protein